MKRINKKKIREIAEKYGLKLVLLFGSQASGKTHFASDFDIAILGERTINIEKELEIQYEFVKIFKTDAVDVVDIRGLSPLLLYRIFHEPHKILFCKDELEYYKFKIYSARKYAEAKPLFDLRDRSIELFFKKHA